MANLMMIFGERVAKQKRLFRGRDRFWHLVKYNADAAIYAKCKCGFHFPCKLPKSLGGDDKINTYSYCPVCGAKKKWITNDIETIDKFVWED
jgi:hypothetical protein